MSFPKNLLRYFCRFGLFAVLLAASAVPGSAQTPLYTNGSGAWPAPINGYANAWPITEGSSAVSDSFLVSGDSILSGVDFGAWQWSGDTITSVDWAIGTSPYGTNDGHGTSAVTDTFYLDNVLYSDVYSDHFNVGGLYLAPGTYYLTLQNAVVTNGDPAWWDENNGLSAGYATGMGNLADSSSDCTEGTFPAFYGGTCSESFQILGTSYVPEPGTLSLLAAGLLALLLLSFRRGVKSASRAA